MKLVKQITLGTFLAAGIGAAYYLWTRKKPAETTVEPEYVIPHPPEEKPAGEPAAASAEEPSKVSAEAPVEESPKE